MGEHALHNRPRKRSRRALYGLSALLLVGSAAAQQRQPAQITTLPATSPQEFDVLDKTGAWVKLGTANGGAFSPVSSTDVRSFGCVADGVTDQAACFQNALDTAPGCVTVPDTQNGFLIKSTIVVKTCLKGQHVSTLNTYPNFLYPGASWLKCDVGANGVCVDSATPDSLTQSPQIENITISGIAGTPPAGSTGLRVPGGFNSRFKGVAVMNFDNCVRVGPGATVAPINANFYDLNLGRCQSHYFIVDGTPEVHVLGGRFGMSGSGEFNALDFVYITKSTNVGAGQGPNGVIFDNIQFNPGSGGSGVQCAVRWGGWTGTGGGQSLWWFTNDYFEWHTDHTPGPTGIFCSDNTVPTINLLFVSNSVTSTGGTTTPLFSLDPATTPSQWFFNDNLFGCSGATLHTGNPGSGIVAQLHFGNNSICSPLTLVADTSAAEVYLDHNHFGALAVSGVFGSLSMVGNTQAAGYTDTATGFVTATGIVPQAFTPKLRFNGVEPADIVYSSKSGTWVRNAKGGFDVTVGLTLTNKGTASAADAASVSGWPLSCGSSFGAATFQAAAGFTGLTGAPGAFMSTTVAGLSQSSATGNITIPYSAFTNTTSLTFTVQCGRAL